MFAHSIPRPRPLGRECMLDCLRYRIGRTAIHFSLIRASRKITQHVSVLRSTLLGQTANHRFNVAQRLRHSGCLDSSRLYDSNTDPEWMQFESQGIAKNSECALSGVDETAERYCDVRAYRTDIDDSSASSSKQREKGLRHCDLTKHINVEDLPQVILSHVFNWSNFANSCHVH